MSDLLTEMTREDNELAGSMLKDLLTAAPTLPDLKTRPHQSPIIQLANRLAKLEHDLESAMKRIQALENHE